MSVSIVVGSAAVAKPTGIDTTVTKIVANNKFLTVLSCSCWSLGVADRRKARREDIGALVSACATRSKRSDQQRGASEIQRRIVDEEVLAAQVAPASGGTVALGHAGRWRREGHRWPDKPWRRDLSGRVRPAATAAGRTRVVRLAGVLWLGDRVARCLRARATLAGGAGAIARSSRRRVESFQAGAGAQCSEGE